MTPPSKISRKRKQPPPTENGAATHAGGLEPTTVPFAVVQHAATKRRKSASGRSAVATPPGVQHYESPYDRTLSFDYKVVRQKMKNEKDQASNAAWDSPAMKKYANIQMGEMLCRVGDIVYVRTDTSNEDYPLPDGVAQILECRAVSPHYVFLRIVWLYRPEDIPLFAERPAHFAHNEVLPTNHMEIIDAASLNNRVEHLMRLVEEGTGNVSIPDDTLIWRQYYDIFDRRLSKAATICKCKQAYNPDDPTFNCENESCAERMHEQCIKDEILRQVYRTEVLGLGTSSASTQSPITNGGMETKEEDDAEGEDGDEPQEDAINEESSTVHVNRSGILGSISKILSGGKRQAETKSTPSKAKANSKHAATNGISNTATPSSTPSKKNKNQSEVPIKEEPEELSNTASQLSSGTPSSKTTQTTPNKRTPLRQRNKPTPASSSALASPANKLSPKQREAMDAASASAQAAELKKAKANFSVEWKSEDSTVCKVTDLRKGKKNRTWEVQSRCLFCDAAL